MAVRAVPEKFLVAFALAGEHRDMVRAIAEAVERTLGSGTVFFDEWFEHYIASPNTAAKLQEIYAGCALAVVCVSDRFGGRPWTQAELEAIRTRQRQERSSTDREELGILPIRVGARDVKGLVFNRIVHDPRGQSAERIAELIVGWLRMIVPASPRAALARTEPMTAAVRPDAFISHAAEDRAWALALVSKLEQSGRRCWIAPRDIRAGTSYPKAITRAIKESRLMIVIVSAHASASEEVLGEVTLAKNNNVLRLPVRIDAAPLGEGLEYHFSQSHWFDAAELTQEEAVHRLNASMATYLD